MKLCGARSAARLRFPRGRTTSPSALLGTLRLLVMLVGCWLWTNQALAESAEQLFEQGEHEFAAGNYEAAAHLFERAHQTRPHASVLFNAAVSWDYGGKLARAADAYRDALAREGLSAEQTEEAERRLDALAKRLGFVQIARPVGGLVSVGHIRAQPIPTRFFLSPGAYEVTLEDRAGVRTRTPISLEAGESLKLVLNTLEIPAEPQPRPPPPAVPPELDQPSNTQEILGWVGVGVGVLAGGAAVYLGLQALEQRDRYNDSQHTDADTRDRAAQLRTGANVAWGGAAAFGVTGAVLVLTAPSIHF